MNINYFILITLFYNISTCYAFNIHKYFEEFHEDFRAETVIYNLLKKWPLNKNIDYVYAPWHSLERNTRLKLKPDLNDLAHLKFNNAFTVCSFDNYERLLPFFKSIGLKTVFSSSGNNTKFDGIDIITIPYFARNNIKPNAKKDIFYSFIGNVRSHKSRAQIFNMIHPKNTVLIKRDIFHYNNKNEALIKKMEKEYADVLSRSRFSLCPRGQSAGTYRFWESLQAGAIPVLISDNYKLPESFDWNSCIIIIKESEIKNLYSILIRISQQKEEELRRNCIAAFEHFCGKNFTRLIRRYYRNKN